MFTVITRKKALRILVSIILLILIFFCLLFSIPAIITHGTTSSSSNNEIWRNHFNQFEPAEKGYSVFVDLDRLTLYLYEDGTEIKTWPVSGGTSESPSPTGNWIVTGIDHWNEGFGGSWIALNVPWGVYGIHGTVEPWVVGNYNASHGCIRMSNNDVAELKQYMSAGVPVHIKHDNAPFRVMKDGHVGSDVLMLQMMLKQLGYYSGTPDGVFGSGTFKAVCDFQSDQGIYADGTVGWESWNRIEELFTA